MFLTALIVGLFLGFYLGVFYVSMLSTRRDKESW